MTFMKCPFCQKPMRQGQATIERSAGGVILGAGNFGVLMFTPEGGEAVQLIDHVERREAHFCDDCGSSVIRGELADEAVQICPACGETNPPNYESCWKCHAAL